MTAAAAAPGLAMSVRAATAVAQPDLTAADAGRVRALAITDGELRALSVEQRLALARRLTELSRAEGKADSASPVWVARRRRTVLVGAVLVCVALIGWMLRLGVDLPPRYVVSHWD